MRRLLATFWQSFMVGHHFCPVLVSLLSRECWFHQLPQRQCGAFVLITFSCGPLLFAKSLSENIVLIIPTTIQPVIIENDVQFCGLGLSQREMSRTIGVLQGAISKSCAVFVRAAVLPRDYVGVNRKQSLQKKTMPFYASWGGRAFSQLSRIRVELIRLTGRRSSDALSLSSWPKDVQQWLDITQNIQADAPDWLIIIAVVDARSQICPKTGTISTGLIRYSMMIPGVIYFCFL